VTTTQPSASLGRLVRRPSASRSVGHLRGGAWGVLAGAGLLAIANAYYPASDTSLAVTLAPIDTNQLRVPADLAGLAFDDPRMIERFNRALEQALSRVPDTQVSVLAIGNESMYTFSRCRALRSLR